MIPYLDESDTHKYDTNINGRKGYLIDISQLLSRILFFAYDTRMLVIIEKVNTTTSADKNE